MNKSKFDLVIKVLKGVIDIVIIVSKTSDEYGKYKEKENKK